MKRFAKVALLAAMMFGMTSSAFAATELSVKGSLDVYGMWSQNLRDFDSKTSDADNYSTWQRLRTYFTFQTNQNLKAVLGIETNNVWGAGSSADGYTSLGGASWGTDGTTQMRVKHAYLDFTIPETVVEVTAGLQAISLPSIFGNPVFDDDAAALVISAPINDNFGLSVGYSRGKDSLTNYDASESVVNDNKDMFFLVAPVKMNGFAVSPYAAYATIGNGITGADDLEKIWVVGANAKLTMFDPFTVAADLIYGQGKVDDYKTAGWYAALAGSYKFDMLTATLFGTYASGAKDDADKDNFLPTLAEGWALTPYLGGAGAFNGFTTDGFFTWTADSNGNANAGLGMWSVGVSLTDIHFVDKLSHDLTVAYAKGTSEAGSQWFDKNVSAWEVYLVNKYMIFENLAAINELGYFAPHVKDHTSNDVDNSCYMTIGLQYKF